MADSCLLPDGAQVLPEATNSLGTRVQFEGKPSWPVPTVHPSTIKTYCVLGLITHVALSPGHMELQI